MSESLFLDFIITSDVVVCRLCDQSRTIQSFYQATAKLDRPDSLEHVEHRSMRLVRDIVSRIDITLLHQVVPRIVYGQEFAFLEPMHIHQDFDTARVITSAEQGSLVMQQISGFQAGLHDFRHALVVDVSPEGVFSSGYPYDGGIAVHGIDIHSSVSYVSGSFHSALMRTLYLAGVIAEHSIERTLFRNIASVLHHSNADFSRAGNRTVVYDIGSLHSNVLVYDAGVLSGAVRAPFGRYDIGTASGSAMFLEHVLSWCMAPTGTMHVHVVSGYEYSDTVVASMSHILQRAQHIRHEYRFTLGSVTYNYRDSNELDTLFNSLFIVA